MQAKGRVDTALLLRRALLEAGVWDFWLERVEDRNGAEADLPKKPGRMHGSSIYIECNDKCMIHALLVVPDEFLEQTLEELDKHGCGYDVHLHAGEKHVHVFCQNKDVKESYELLKFMGIF